jgi:hypothetical protein
LTLDRPENFEGKMAVFTPKLQWIFFKSVKPFDGFKKKPYNLGDKTTVFPWFKNGLFWVKSGLVLTSGPF